MKLPQTPTTVLGLKATDLSLQDICEEITDVKRDIAAIEQFNEGKMTAHELTRITMFKPVDLPSLKQGLQVLKEWKFAATIDQGLL